MILLIGAAWVLPPLDSRMPLTAVTRVLILACCTVLVLATCVGTVRYSRHGWSKARTVPNRTGYVTWLILETLAALLVLAIALATAWNTYTVRTAIRWSARSSYYKAHLLAQPVSPSGELKHIEWDSWGWAAQDTTVYLVFDPNNSLSTGADNKQLRRYGLPCEVARMQRLESQWYTVQMYRNDDCWR